MSMPCAITTILKNFETQSFGREGFMHKGVQWALLRNEKLCF